MAQCQSVVLASLFSQVRGVRIYELGVCGASQGDRVVLVRRPDNRYDVNCMDVRVVCGHLSYMLGHLAAEVAAHVSPLLCDSSLKASG